MQQSFTGTCMPFTISILPDRWDSGSFVILKVNADFGEVIGLRIHFNAAFELFHDLFHDEEAKTAPFRFLRAPHKHAE